LRRRCEERSAHSGTSSAGRSAGYQFFGRWTGETTQSVHFQ
jgi:hypothetical protein